MPKEAFYRLENIKQNQIFKASVKEFAAQRFSEASINRIIKDADIARGSFYRYFEDKEDLYLYVFDEIIKEKHQMAISRGLTNLKNDVFENFIRVSVAGREFSEAHPEYTKIAVMMEKDGCPFITELRSALIVSLAELIKLDQQSGNIKAELNPFLTADMIYTLIVRKFEMLTEDYDRFVRETDQIVSMLKNGISARP